MIDRVAILHAWWGAILAALPEPSALLAMLVMSTVVLCGWAAVDRWSRTLLGQRSASRVALWLVLLTPVIWTAGERMNVEGWLPSSFGSTGASVGVANQAPVNRLLEPSSGPLRSTVAAPGASDAASSSATVIDVLFMVWLVGAAIALIRLLLGLSAAFGWLRRSVASSPEICDAAVREASRIGMRWTPRVRSSGDIDVPMSLALPVPTILVPSSQSNGDDLSAFLAHECAHLASGDSPVGLLQRCAEVGLWFHPLMHRLSRRIDDVAERLADRSASVSMGSRLRYARSLLAVADRQCASSRAAGLFASVRGRRPARLTDRIEELVSEVNTPEGRSMPHRAVLSFLLIGGVLLGCRAAAPDGADRVLLVDVSPSWEFRYLKNELLRRENLVTNTLLLFADEDFEMERSASAPPVDRWEDISGDCEGFDTVILSGVHPNDLDGLHSGEAAMSLRRFVHGGGRLVLIPGEVGLGGLRVEGLEPLIAEAFERGGDDPVFSPFGQGEVVVIGGEGTWKLRGSDPTAYEEFWSEVLTE